MRKTNAVGVFGFIAHVEGYKELMKMLLAIISLSDEKKSDQETFSS